MTQRIALLLAGALTIFVLVLMAGVGLTVATKSFVTTQAATQLQAPASDVTIQQPAAASDAVAVRLTPDQAAAIATSVVPNAKIVRAPELVNFQGAVAYEVGLNQGNVYVDANSGKVLFNGASTNVAAQTGRREQRNEVHEGDNHD